MLLLMIDPTFNLYHWPQCAETTFFLSGCEMFGVAHDENVRLEFNIYPLLLQNERMSNSISPPPPPSSKRCYM